LRGNPQQIEWRRSQVLELSSKGYNQSDISKRLQLDKSIISRDVAHLRTQARENIKNYINERLPEEYEKCLVGITSIMKEAWNTSERMEDNREKIQALSLAKDRYSMKLELLTNATVVDDVIKFIETKGNDIQRPQEKTRDPAIDILV
jgi:transposase